MSNSCNHPFDYLTLRKSKIPGSVLICCIKCNTIMSHHFEQANITLKY